jgi:hypothetical protein
MLCIPLEFQHSKSDHISYNVWGHFLITSVAATNPNSSFAGAADVLMLRIGRGYTAKLVPPASNVASGITDIIGGNTLAKYSS